MSYPTIQEQITMELMNKCELIGTKPGEGIHTQAGHSEFLEFRSELFQKLNEVKKIVKKEKKIQPLVLMDTLLDI